MILKEPEYISMQEAANTYDVSIERLRIYAEVGQLPVYAKSPTSHQYCRFVELEWNFSNLKDTMAISIDNKGIPSNESPEVMNCLGFTDSMLLIKPSELLALANEDICNPAGAMNNTENQQFPGKFSNPGLSLKKLQTAEIDERIQILLKKIKKAVAEHMQSKGKERTINHARFVNEEKFQDGKEKTRALKLVREYIKSEKSGIAYHGYDYARKKIKEGAPYFLQ